jgi:glycosyltransferase involved in cell wall biosynthesis
MRALFVNENIGGHAAMHLHLRGALKHHSQITTSFLDVPPAGLLRRVVGASLPWLGRWDLDLQPLRAQLGQGLYIRRRVRPMLHSFDVLHVYSVNAGLAIPDLLRARPSVVSTDSTNQLNAYSLPYRQPTRWTGEALRLHGRIERKVYESATFVVAQSEWVAASLREDYGVPEERLRVIPFGVTIPAVPEPQPPTSSELPQVTFVGTSMARKGGWRLLRVFRQHLRTRCTLNLVTREDVPPQLGVRIIRDLIPGDPRLFELLARTAIFALPTEIDKSSYAVLEAMASGVPIVTTRFAALPELAPDGLAGRLIDPGDDEQLGAALIELLDDEGLRRRLGDNARRRVLERFDARVTTANLVETLNDACERWTQDRHPRQGP